MSYSMEWNHEEWEIERYVIMNGLTDLQALTYKNSLLRKQYEHSRIVSEVEPASPVETASDSE